jgi:hypothetical protein
MNANPNRPTRVLPVLAVTSLVSLVGRHAAAVQSTFDADDEGWMVAADTGENDFPDYMATGGMPAGHIRAQDFGGGSWFFVAPDAFLGDISFALGGTIECDLLTDGIDDPSDEADDVILRADALTLRWDVLTLDNPTDEWTHFSFPLVADQWSYANSGLPVSEQDFVTVLSSLDALLIRGDWREIGSDVGSIDNVAILAPNTCAGDIDRNGGVSFGDLTELLAAWGVCPHCAADLDGSGSVGFADLSMLLNAWGACP